MIFPILSCNDTFNYLNLIFEGSPIFGAFNIYICVCVSVCVGSVAIQTAERSKYSDIIVELHL